MYTSSSSGLDLLVQNELEQPKRPFLFWFVNVKKDLTLREYAILSSENSWLFDTLNLRFYHVWIILHTQSGLSFRICEKLTTVSKKYGCIAFEVKVDVLKGQKETIVSDST